MKHPVPPGIPAALQSAVPSGSLENPHRFVTFIAHMGLCKNIFYVYTLQY